MRDTVLFVSFIIGRRNTTQACAVHASTIFYNSNIATEKLAFSVTQISFASPTLITWCVSDSFNFIKNKLDISFFLVDRGCSFH